MSERWRTGEEIEKAQITLGLRDKVDFLENKAKVLAQDAYLCVFGAEAMFAAAVLTDKYVAHHWGKEQDLYVSLGGLLLGISVAGYRQHKSAKNRAFDVERQLIELELESD